MIGADDDAVGAEPVGLLEDDHVRVHLRLVALAGDHRALHPVLASCGVGMVPVVLHHQLGQRIVAGVGALGVGEGPVVGEQRREGLCVTASIAWL